MKIIRLKFLIGIIVLPASVLFIYLSSSNHVKNSNAIEKNNQTVDIQVVEAVNNPAIPIDNFNSLKDKDNINILLLGLDSRKTSTDARCDAIHMFSFDLKNKTINITSIPRGTLVDIPNTNLLAKPTSTETLASLTHSYMAQACAMAGIDYTVRQIENRIKMKSDYVIKVGFSQTLGILRVLKLPTTESLQWLRNRKTYAIGDNQRSYNQAVFMKDIFLNHIEDYNNLWMRPIFRIAYSFLDIKMDYNIASDLIKYYLSSEIQNHPEKITLKLYSLKKPQELHFNFSDPQKSLTAIYTPSSTVLIEQIQKNLIDYLEQRLRQKENLKDIFQKKLWLQIEDNQKREELHYRLVEKQLNYISKKEEKEKFINEYLDQMDALELKDYYTKGKKLQQAI